MDGWPHVPLWQCEIYVHTCLHPAVRFSPLEGAAPAGARPWHSFRGRRDKPAFAEPFVHPGAKVAGAAASSTDQIRFRDWLTFGVNMVHM